MKESTTFMNPTVKYFHDQGVTISRAELAIQHKQSFLNELLAKQLYIPENMQTALLKRRCEFIAGRWCAIHAMKQIGIKQARQPNVGENNEPIWQTNVKGSISHTCDTAVAVVMLPNKGIKGIGIDREIFISSQLAEKFAQKIISTDELKFCEYFSNYELFVTLVFSSKEALFKAMFPQIQRNIGFNVAQISGVDLEKKILELTLTQTLNKHLFAGRKIKILYSQNATAIETCTVI